MGEKRLLNRIENKFGDDLFCLVQAEGREVRCEIVNFNSTGIRVSCDSLRDAQLITSSQVLSAKINYGESQIGEFLLPRVSDVRADGKEFVLIHSNRKQEQFVVRAQRANIPDLLEPLLIGPDPIRLKETIVLRIENISIDGFRAKCSLSNRHLFVGQKIEGFKIYLPTIGEINCSFKIVNVRAEEKFLHIGCEFLKREKKDAQKIKSFLLLALFAKKDSDQVEGIRPDAKISRLIRVRRIDSHEDFQAVMRLRFDAYKGANKLVETATIENMTDEFDQNSIILGSFLGARLVGTIRIVFSQSGSGFPFEKYFEFPTHIAGLSRESSVEISKLAIDPQFQGSDVLFRLFQSFAMEFMPKRSHGLLMSTDTLAKNYVSIGARKISGSKPHPVLKDEKLCLYLLETEKLKRGQMSALAWLFFAREIIDFMSRFGFTKRTSFPVWKYLLAPLEIAAKLSRKWRKRLSKGKNHRT